MQECKDYIEIERSKPMPKQDDELVDSYNKEEREEDNENNNIK
jgi:hypothetical protein